MKKFIIFKLCLVFVFSFAFCVHAQDAPKVEDFKLNSKLMSREMPYRVIFPSKYDQKDEKTQYPVLYLLHGLTGHFSNWSEKTKLIEFSRNYKFVIVLVEGDDGWYSDSISAPNDKYESYIIQELIPTIEAKFRAKNNRENRVMAGLSMGGYGSLKFGLKYPDKFVLVGSFSGALGAASFSVKTLGNSWKALTDSIDKVYGADDSQTRKDNDIYKMVREMPAEKVKSLPFIYLDCGTEDGLVQSNREFNALLVGKKIPHEFRELPGKHDWIFWNSQIEEFLQVTTKFVK
ncbi:MAG TPA: alpha/beta hydrolase family protein [Pyrinomonadaceae bacterium]|nr:alpha/beta hydrolase family protein [Pyrinomonadaceae bacterium]